MSDDIWRRDEIDSPWVGSYFDIGNRWPGRSGVT